MLRARKLTLAFSILPFILLSLIVGVGVYYQVSARESVPSAEERTLLVQVEPLIEDFDPRYATFKKTEYFDGSYDVEYEYNDPREGGPRVSASVKIEVSASDAETAYFSEWTGAVVGLRLLNLKVVEENTIYSWGDRSRMGFIQVGDRVIGNLFVGQKGRKVFHLMIQGIFFLDMGGAEELLGVPLERLEAHPLR